MKYRIFIPSISLGIFSFLFLGVQGAEAQSLRYLSAEQWRPATISVWESDFSSRVRFDAYDDSQIYGGHLDSYDVDNDGTPEIILGAGEGAKPYVKIFNLDGEEILSFLAYEETYLGGVRVAVGDLNGDGQVEIVTSPGRGMEPLVRVFDKDGNYTDPNSFHAYAPGFGGEFILLLET